MAFRTHSLPKARKHEANRQRTREFHTGSKVWREIRRWVLLRDSYTCQICWEFGNHVDHVDGDAKNNPPDGSNWQTLCGKCHGAKTAGETGIVAFLPRLARKPSIPVTLVSGPPAAGKTTFIAQHRDADDIVIDLDVIKDEIGKDDVHAAMAERNKRLFALSEAERGKCWFIAMAPTRHERRHWAEALGADVIVLEVSADECLRRALADPKRQHRPAEFWERIIHGWWRRYVRSPDDQVLTAWTA